jgi:hypothetical protein
MYPLLGQPFWPGFWVPVHVLWPVKFAARTGTGPGAH